MPLPSSAMTDICARYGGTKLLAGWGLRGPYVGRLRWNAETTARNIP